MLTKLIALIISINQYALNEYACRTVDAFHSEEDKYGCYEWCLSKSLEIKTVGRITDPNSDYTSAPYNGNTAPIGLSDDFPHHIQNACAIVMIGGEW